MIGVAGDTELPPSLTTLITRIFCFEGDISTVICVGNRNSEKIYELFARVNPHSFDTLVRLLSTCEFPKGWQCHPYRMDTYRIIDDNRNVVDVNLKGLTRFSWRQQPRDFDIDTLCRNGQSMYIADDSSMLFSATHIHKGDVLNLICMRIKNKRFCLLKNNYNADGRTGERMDRGYALVRNGWTMDNIARADPWFICPWWLLTHPNHVLRGMFGLPSPLFHPADGHRSSVICVMCHDVIHPSDIVMRLSCGHVFHCRCADAHTKTKRFLNDIEHDYDKDGIIRWFEEGNSMCPVCREGISG